MNLFFFKKKSPYYFQAYIQPLTTASATLCMHQDRYIQTSYILLEGMQEIFRFWLFIEETQMLQARNLTSALHL